MRASRGTEDKMSNAKDERPTTTMKTTRASTSPSYRLPLVFGGICVTLICITLAFSSARSAALWIVSCGIPLRGLARQVQQPAWEHWELQVPSAAKAKLNVATVDMQNFTVETILPHLESTFGEDWQRRPLLLKDLWTREELMNPQRHLSPHGLAQEETVVDYFSDARGLHALIPDAAGRVRDIVHNMTHRGLPHKIGSQLILDAHPEWIREVAPEIVTTMFGDRFQPQHIQSRIIVPAMTTVPVFVAPALSTNNKDNSPNDSSSKGLADERPPHTALHCEPIGNVAVQLSGQKQWTLVAPEYSLFLRPALAPDGRAYFASFQDIRDLPVPHYSVVTNAGDALWVPTWTWHHVDYTNDGTTMEDDLAVGASLFHFRPMDFWNNNPLFAILLIPAMIRELVGLQRQ